MTNDLLKDNLAIDEDDWFERINLYFSGDYENSDEEIVEHVIMEYDILTSKYQYHINIIYDNLFSTISSKINPVPLHSGQLGNPAFSFFKRWLIFIFIYPVCCFYVLKIHRLLWLDFLSQTVD